MPNSRSKLVKRIVIFLIICFVSISSFIIFYVIQILQALGFFTQTGYVKENGNWIYVTSDEGNPKRVSKLNDVDNGTFVVLKCNYAKDKNTVFHYSSVLKDADPSTFEIIDDKYGYAKDSKYVYIDGGKVIDANPGTFTYLEFPYSKDDKHVYCGTLPMFVNNIEEFKVIKAGKSISHTDTNFFIETNPEYSFIDSTKYPWVLYSFEGKGETKTQKFESYKEVQ